MEHPRDIGVIVVDDHGAVREGIRALLEAEPNIALRGAASDARSALSLVSRFPADVAVLDYHLPDEDGLSLCLRLKGAPRPPRVLVYSGFADEHLAIRAVVAGADALLPKSSDPGELPRCVQRLARGEGRVPSASPSSLRIAGRLLDPDDLPILGMLLHGTRPEHLAEALGVDARGLAGRRLKMLNQLQRSSAPAQA
jgi:DNA-binding NarL/FixJ family response regulator